VIKDLNEEYYYNDDLLSHSDHNDGSAHCNGTDNQNPARQHRLMY